MPVLLSFPAYSESSLPEIGGGYSVITGEQEYRLGRSWSRLLRGSARVYDDALVTQYLEDLTWNLASYSQLTDRRLEIVVLDNPTLNAFAVPGGIIGIHAGLLLTAQTEGQLASVISHELAHLSQRHFAAQLEAQRRYQPFMIASILGSLILAAADPEGGMAALQTSIAASTSSRLSFSRQNEREADYIGMQTLIAAGYDSHEMPRMFNEMQQAYRFSRKPPEFLLTHPVTQSRIAESLDRAEQANSHQRRVNSIDFNIVKARIQSYYSKDKQQLFARYKAAEEKDNTLYYAMAVTAISLKQFKEAEKAITKMSSDFRKGMSIHLLKAEIAHAQRDYKRAEKQLKQLATLYPGNQAIKYLLADTYLKRNKANEAVKVYRSLVDNQPRDNRAWYLLAEACGLAGEIIALHEARIEYFLLTANIDKAVQQIDYALKEPELTEYQRSRFEMYRDEAKLIRKALKMEF